MNALKTSDHPQVSPGHLMESMTNHLSDILIERLEQTFDDVTYEIEHQKLAEIASEYGAIDLAYAAPRLPSSIRYELFKNLDSLKDRVNFIIHTDTDSRVVVLREISNEELRQILNYMPSDEAVVVMEDLSERRVRKMLQLLDIKKALHIRELISHERNTAGRLMTNEFFSFSKEKTIQQVAEKIKNSPGVDFTRSIFVVSQEGKLEGIVPARILLTNPADTTIGSIMRPVVHQIFPEGSREEVIDLVERYRIPELPVVNHDGFMVGVINYDDVLELMEDLTDETMARMAGTGENLASYQHGFKRFIARAPWLLVTLLAGLINMEVMQYHEKTMQPGLMFLMFFVPLINGLSGNIGLQCSTVLVRGMAVGSVSKGNRRSVAIKELILGITTGVVFALLCTAAVYFLGVAGLQTTMGDPLHVGIIIGGGLISACVAGTVLGVTAPLLFATLGVDPAVAAGPIITAFNDFLAMSIYFVVAVLLSGWLTMI